MDPQQLSALSSQLKETLEDHDRRTQSSLERMRGVIYNNKKALEGPIHRNKIVLDGLSKTGRYMWIIIAVLSALLVWMIVVNLQLRKHVDQLSETSRLFETQTLKDLSRVEGGMHQIQRTQDRQDDAKNPDP